MAVYDQIPATVNTVSRLTNFACRAFYYLHRKNKVELPNGNNSYIFPMAQLAENDQDDFGNLIDKFTVAVPVSPDIVAGTNAPWTYATIPLFTDSGTLTDYFDGTTQTTFNLPNTVNTIPKLTIFACRLWKQMYGSRKIYIPDELGSRQWPIATMEGNRADINGALYEIHYLFMPKEDLSIAGNVRPWTRATTPAIVQTPPGYFAS